MSSSAFTPTNSSLPVSARNILGDTSSVPAGYIGENQTVQNTTGTALTTGGAILASITLSAGVWFLTASVTASGATDADVIGAYWQGMAANLADIHRTAASQQYAALVARPRVVTISSSTTYNLVGQNLTASRGNGFCTIVAVRVA